MHEVNAQNQLPAIAEEANEDKMHVLIETIEEAIGIIKQNRDEEIDVMQERASIMNAPVSNYKFSNDKIDSKVNYTNNNDQYRISKFKLIVLMSLMFMSVVGIVFGFQMLATLN